MSYSLRCTGLSLLICGALVMLRPAILGGNLTPLGMGLFCAAALLAYLSLPAPTSFAGATDERSVYFCLVQTLMVCTLWVYSLTVAVVLGQSHMDFVIKGFASTVIVVGGMFVLGLWRDLKDRIFLNFAKFNALAGASTAVTWVLLKVMPYGALHYFTIPVKNYENWAENSGDVLLPFTIVYGLLSDYDVYRFSGWFRETGIAQFFFVWSFIVLHDRQASRWWQLGALLGTLLCGSSIALLSLLAALGIYHGLNPQSSLRLRLSVAGVATLLVLGSLFLPGIGFKDKQATHRASMTDRTEAVSTAFSEGDALLFGKGLYYRHAPHEGMGINAISQIYFTGIMGFVLHMSIYAVGLGMARGVRRQYAAMMAPAWLTSVFFQPLIDAPTLFILLHYVPFASARPATPSPPLRSPLKAVPATHPTSRTKALPSTTMTR